MLIGRILLSVHISAALYSIQMYDHETSNRACCHITISTILIRVGLIDTSPYPLLQLFGHSQCRDNTYTLLSNPAISAGASRVRVLISKMMITAVRHCFGTYLAVDM